MQQLSFDGSETPVLPERPTAKQLTMGTFLACSDCGAYVHNASGADGATCPGCGKWATRHGARLAARQLYGVPLPVGVLDPLAANRMVVSAPGPNCNVTTGVSNWCAQPVPCWTDPESPCHMPILESKEIALIDTSELQPHSAQAAMLYNQAAEQYNVVARRHHSAQIELIRCRKERDLARLALNTKQEEMYVASRTNHDIEKQLAKFQEAIGQIAEHMKALGVPV